MLAHEVKVGDFVAGYKVREVFRAAPYDVTQGWVRLSFETGADRRCEWNEAV